MESVSFKPCLFQNRTVTEKACRSHSKAVAHRNLDCQPSCRVAHKKLKMNGECVLVQREAPVLVLETPELKGSKERELLRMAARFSLRP